MLPIYLTHKERNAAAAAINALLAGDKWPKDIDVSAADLESALDKLLDARPQTISTAAATLGAIRTPKKAAAAQANGRKGGRPPKYQPH